jgi:hypothetical protein
VAVPGTEGDAGLPGTDGVDGIDAFTTTTADITIPAAAGNVTTPAVQTFVSTLWMGIGQKIFISDGTQFGTFEVLTLPSGTSATLEWLEYAGESGFATLVIDSGATVSPSGTQPALATPLPTAITDNSTGTASNTIATLVNQRFVVMSFPILLTSLDTPADLVTDFVLPFKGAIISWQFIDEVVATSGGTADAAVQLELGSTLVTGSSTTLTQADFAAIGQRKAGGIITAANTFNANAIFSIVCTSSAVNFTAGKINAYVTFSVREDALNDAIASLADHVNDLITSLT